MYASKNKDSPQDLLKDIEENGGRLLLTIPFGSSKDKCVGFVAVSGDSKSLPVLFFCIQNVTLEKCTVSTIVFPSTEEYNNFCERLYFDNCNNFLKTEETYE